MSVHALACKSTEFWNEVNEIKGNSKGVAKVIDGAQGADIADVFADKYNTLYNYVSYCTAEMGELKRDVNNSIMSDATGSNIGVQQSISADDVVRGVSEMKSGKSDSNHQFYTDHLLHGPQRLYVSLSMLFTAMLVHGVIPSDISVSTLIPIPKNKKKSLNDSDNYRAIAVGSIIGKLLDKIILYTYSDSFITMDHQFGFKKQHSTTQCTFVVNEVIKYYNRNGSTVRAVLLDASKAFDRVHYVKLFRLQLPIKLCLLVLKCILNMYTNQKIRVKWGNKVTPDVGISNGVKQGGVLSPVLFTVYLDELLRRMSNSRFGCYIDNIFCGTLAYADDVIILAPSVASLRGMLSICESFANDYNIIFNSRKSKLLVFPEVDNKEVSIMFLGGIIEHVVECNHLGNIIGVSSHKRNIEANIWQFYAKLNVLMRDFCYVNFEIKYLLMKTYCMSLFGSPLWELDGKNISSFYVAWRKGVQKLLSLPYNTHCVLLNLICHDTTIDNQLDRRVVKFLACCKISNNTLVKLCYNLACNGSQSAVDNNMTFLCSKYGICRARLNCDDFNYSTCISKCSEIITNDVGASMKVEIIRGMLSVIEKCRLDDRRSAGFDHSQAYNLMCELCSN